MIKEFIEREAVIKAIMSEPPDAHYPQWYVDKIKPIPAADVVEVQHGRWNRPYISWFLPLKIKNPHCFCTNCAYPMKHKKVTRFCPNCGAKMDEEGV